MSLFDNRQVLKSRTKEKWFQIFLFVFDLKGSRICQVFSYQSFKDFKLQGVRDLTIVNALHLSGATLTTQYVSTKGLVLGDLIRRGLCYCSTLVGPSFNPSLFTSQFRTFECDLLWGTGVRFLLFSVADDFYIYIYIRNFSFTRVPPFS